MAHKKRQSIEAERGIETERGEGLVAGGSGAHVAPGINRRIVHAHFVVDVRTGGAAADTRVADHLAALNARPGHRGKRR